MIRIVAIATISIFVVASQAQAWFEGIALNGISLNGIAVAGAETPSVQGVILPSGETFVIAR